MQSCFSISARVGPGTCFRVHLVPAGSGGHDLGVAENWLESI